MMTKNTRKGGEGWPTTATRRPQPPPKSSSRAPINRWRGLFNTRAKINLVNFSIYL